MTKQTYIAVSFVLLLAGCGDSDGVTVNMTEAPQNVVAVQDINLPLTADQLCSDVTVETAGGVRLRGKRRCQAAKKVCAKIGDTACQMRDSRLYGVHHPKLKPENIRKGVKMGAKTGEATTDYPACSRDGQTGCITRAGVVSVDAATIAAKTPQGETLGGVAGSFDPGYPDPQHVLATDTVNGQPGQITTCSAAGESNCIATPAFKPVPTAELDPASIRQGAVIGGVTGTYPGAFAACVSDGETDCITSAGLVAMRPTSVTASRIRQNVKLAGVTGSLLEAPAICDGTAKTGCVTSASFPAADYNLLQPSQIKAGVSVATATGTVTGAFPSAAHPLPGATAAHVLSAANFNARMASPDTFQYWSASGVRQSGTGDADLAASHIVTGTTIFGVAGSVTASPAPCSDTLDTNCVTTASHVSYDKNLLTSANIKTGTVVNAVSGAVTGAYPSASHPLPNASATADLQGASFANQVSSGGTAFEYWDATGARHSHLGSNTLLPANLVAGATVFGVAGSSAVRPANCTSSTHTRCVTSSSHPAYDPANLPAAMIKTGTTIGLVTGTYPSAGNPLTGASGTADLTAATFNSQLRSAAGFEYWDHVGNRYTGSGSTLLRADNITSATAIFGLTGTMAPSPNACSGPGQTGCLAVATFPSYNPASLTAPVIKHGHVIDGITGTYPSVLNPLAGADSGVADALDQADLYSKLPNSASFEFWDSAGHRHVAAGDSDLSGANIVSGVTILGVAGAMTPRPGDCSSEGQSGCMATATYRAFTAASLTPGVLKSGVTLGGVTGDYPSAAHPLANNTAARDLFESGASFGVEATTPGLVEFWDSAGNFHSHVREGLGATDIRQGTTILSVAGSAEPAPAACSAGTSQGCLTSAAFPAFQSGELSAGIIKDGVTIGGVTGDYPSASFPLPGGTATANLDFATFTAKIKSPAEFEYWDADGSRHTGNGDGDLIPANIVNGESIFGETGTMHTTGTIAIDMNDVRAGVTVGGATGLRKVSCANTATSGSSGNVTTDDYNGGAGSLPPREPFGASKSCRTGSFTDNRFEGMDCSSAFECEFQDKITGKTWRSTKQNGASTNLSWIAAKKYCSDRGMRMPTHKEMMTVYVNGFRQASLVNPSLWMWDAKLWLGTAPSTSLANRMVVILRHFNMYSESPTDNAEKRTFCISP